MCPNIVTPLEQTRSYIYCPLCKSNGNRTELRRDMHIMKCTLGHQFDYGVFQSMMQSGNPPEMIKTEVIEVPSPNSIKVGIFVHPQIWELIQQKFHGRLHVTLATFLESLANESILFVDGEAAGKLRKRGIINGAQMLSAIEGMDQLEEERDQAIEQLKKFQAILQAAGIGSI